MEWFSTWFDSQYYHILYQHRNDDEAHFFINNLIQKYKPTPSSTMLDLACGKGRHSIYLASKNFDVTGVDLSEQSILHASKSSHDRLHFYVHDMRKNFRSNYYNFIFSFFTSFGYFENERDNDATLNAIRRGLKPNGIFVMDFMNADKVIQNLVTEEKKTIQDITFNIERKFEQGKIIKSIQFSDKGKDYFFEEKVRGFQLYELSRLFRKCQLNIIDIYGDYDLSSFDIKTSNRLILVAQKK